MQSNPAPGRMKWEATMPQQNRSYMSSCSVALPAPSVPNDPEEKLLDFVTHGCKINRPQFSLYYPVASDGSIREQQACSFIRKIERKETADQIEKDWEDFAEHPDPASEGDSLNESPCKLALLKIIQGEKKFFVLVDKEMLRQKSPLFKSMISGSFVEREDKVIEIKCDGGDRAMPFSLASLCTAIIMAHKKGRVELPEACKGPDCFIPLIKACDYWFHDVSPARGYPWVADLRTICEERLKQLQDIYAKIGNEAIKEIFQEAIHSGLNEMFSDTDQTEFLFSWMKTSLKNSEKMGDKADFFVTAVLPFIKSWTPKGTDHLKLLPRLMVKHRGKGQLNEIYQALCDRFRTAIRIPNSPFLRNLRNFGGKREEIEGLINLVLRAKPGNTTLNKEELEDALNRLLPCLSEKRCLHLDLTDFPAIPPSMRMYFSGYSSDSTFHIVPWRSLHVESITISLNKPNSKELRRYTLEAHAQLCHLLETSFSSFKEITLEGPMEYHNVLSSIEFKKVDSVCISNNFSNQDKHSLSLITPFLEAKTFSVKNVANGRVQPQFLSHSSKLRELYIENSPWFKLSHLTLTERMPEHFLFLKINDQPIKHWPEVLNCSQAEILQWKNRDLPIMCYQIFGSSQCKIDDHRRKIGELEHIQRCAKAVFSS